MGGHSFTPWRAAGSGPSVIRPLCKAPKPPSTTASRDSHTHPGALCFAATFWVKTPPSPFTNPKLTDHLHPLVTKLYPWEANSQLPSEADWKISCLFSREMTDPVCVPVLLARLWSCIDFQAEFCQFSSWDLVVIELDKLSSILGQGMSLVFIEWARLNQSPVLYTNGEFRCPCLPWDSPWWQARCDQREKHTNRGLVGKEGAKPLQKMMSCQTSHVAESSKMN